MANSPCDRLSNLPDALLLTIISFLPTPTTARTSVLCRCFRHLWEASPSLALSPRYIPHPKTDLWEAMVKRALLDRNPSHPLLSLHLEVGFYNRSASLLSSLLDKARSLNLRQLAINFHCPNRPVLPIIFTINSLSYLQHCSELCSLEDLQLYVKFPPGLSLSSQTIRKLKLVIAFSTQKLDIVGSCLPSLESLHLEIQHSVGLGCLSQSHIHGEFSLLRKAVINLHGLCEGDVRAVAQLLNCISHVEELSLHIKESELEKYPIPTFLEDGKDVPNFVKLKQLDVTLCFHEHNFEAVTRLLQNSPVLKSLKLVHEIPVFTRLAKGRKRKDWGSRLPRNADGNYRYAYFKNLHLEENHKEVVKLLSQKCSSKKQALN